MKPHLVIVCGILYPNPSPTGLCAARYASLLTDLYDIEFVALSSNGKEEVATYDGHRVQTLSSKRMALEHKTRGIVSKGIHLLGSAQLKLSLLGNLGWFVSAVYNKLEEIHNQRPIDAILTVCSPLQAHLAGAQFKERHANVRFCAYTVDPYATSARVVPFFRSIKDFVRLEKAVCSKTDCLFLSEEAYNTRDDVYGEIKNKLPLPYLLPQSSSRNGDLFDKSRTHCVYAGSFYHDIRNPEFMLKVVSSLTNKDITLHLYSSGCDDLIRQYASNSSNIEIHGFVSQDELQEVYASCDILIGVGNAMNDFLPSKTYEYLSLRRPIVFFNPKGFNNKVLAKYPHALQLFDDESVEIAVNKFEDFVSKEKGNTISEKELNELYSTNTATHVREILLKGLQLNN